MPRPSGPSKALKLGARGKEVDNFVDKLKLEGETIMPTMGKRPSDASKALPSPINVERCRPALHPLEITSHSNLSRFAIYN